MSDLEFFVTVRRDVSPGAWTVATLPGTGELLGVRGPVKVTGTLRDVPFRATLLPLGGGDHLLPIRADLRRATGVDDGDEVTVRLEPLEDAR